MTTFKGRRRPTASSSGYWGAEPEPDPELERQEKLFFAVQEKNVDKVRQCLDEGIPAEPLRQHNPSGMGNLVKAVSGIERNSPDDRCIQILGLLRDAQGKTPFKIQPLEAAFNQAIDRGLSCALDVLVPLFPKGLAHKFPGEQNLYWKAVALCRSHDQYPFGRLGGPEMVEWLLERSSTQIPLEQRLEDQHQALQLFVSRSNGKSGTAKWERENHRRCANVLIAAQSPLVTASPADQSKSILLNMTAVAMEPNSGYRHWLEAIVADSQTRPVMESVRDKLTDVEWNGYREVLLAQTLETAPDVKRPGLRF